ncbi:hypothetical protein HYFRA_00000380, partial [Hymenoscyphus fraxineus]
MSHLNHSPINPTTPPEPTKPITADLLLTLELQQHQRFGGPNQERQRVSTGCEVLDTLFDGGESVERGRGVERGSVVGVSAEGREGVLLSLNLLVSLLIPHLLTSKTHPPIAQIIDTTGSFPLPLLAQVLHARISSHLSLQSPSESSSATEQELHTHVQRALERISISRVFDIAGLWEVLREINDPPPTPPTPTPPAAGQSSPDWGSNLSSASAPVDDDEKENEKEDVPSKSFSTGNEGEKPGEEEGIQILIIHTLTPLINDLLARREKSEAHTLLTTLSTTLHTLTKTTNILTLLHNTTVPTSSSSSSSSSIQPLFPTPLKPALGQIFTPFPTLHILFSTLPLTRRDAEILYSSSDHTHPLPHNPHPKTTSHSNPTPAPDETTKQEEEIKYCFVLEILQDSMPARPPYTKGFGEREGKWRAVC